MRNGFAFHFLGFISSLPIGHGRIKTYGKYLGGRTFRPSTWNTDFWKKGVKTNVFLGDEKDGKGQKERPFTRIYTN